MTDYSTDFVKKCATDEVYNGELVSPLEFDRWLNEERAKAWDLARSEVRSIPSWYNPETAKGGFDLQPLGPDASSEEGAWNAVMEILDQNPYRKADQ